MVSAEIGTHWNPSGDVCACWFEKAESVVTDVVFNSWPGMDVKEWNVGGLATGCAYAYWLVIKAPDAGEKA